MFCLTLWSTQRTIAGSLHTTSSGSFQAQGLALLACGFLVLSGAYGRNSAFPELLPAFRTFGSSVAASLGNPEAAEVPFWRGVWDIQDQSGFSGHWKLPDGLPAVGGRALMACGVHLLPECESVANSDQHVSSFAPGAAGG